MSETISESAVEAFIQRWSGTAGGAERANYQMFLSELVALLDLPKPEPATHETERNDYVFERFVRKTEAGEPVGTGRIDLYKRGCFVLEAKQSRWKGAAKHRATLDQAALPEIADTVQHAPARYDVLMRDARRQAEDYARALPHEWPPFIIVCDVGRAFELYFDWSGMGKDYGFFPDKQHYRIELEQLSDPEVRKTLRAIWTDPKSIDPRLKAAEVTRGIAKRLADVSAYLEKSNRFKAREAGLESLMIEETSLFLMRIIFCMFAEDIGLLPQDRFKAFLADTIDKGQRFEEGLHDLWAKMNARGGGFAWALDDAVRWFNGGLFESNRTYVLSNADRGELLAAAKADWRKVEPAIFGTLLEQALTAEERAKLGAHYTPRPYVERLVEATIMDVLRAEWRQAQAEIEEALKSSPERGGGPAEPVEGVPRPARGSDGPVPRASTDPLHHSASPNGPPPRSGEDHEALAIAAAFHDRLAAVRVLDPACGTGNFLYVAMELMQRLESEVMEAIQGLGGEAHARVGPQQYYGLELNPRAAKIAELVLWIGWLRFRIRNNPEDVPEPVLKRSANINFGRHGGYDAVLRRKETGEPDLDTPMAPAWPEAEFIVGNPPFIGGKDLRDRLGGDYAEALWKANPSVPKSADFVMQWWDRAAELLTAPDTKLRRFGFVTTNSITQEFSRRVIAAHLSKSSPERGGGPAKPVEGAPSPARDSDGQGPRPSTGPLHHSASPNDGQVRFAPRTEAMSGGHGDQPIPPRSGEDQGLSLVLAIPDHPWTRATRDSAAVRIAMTVAEAGAKPGCLMEVTRETGLDSDEPAIELASTEARIHANLAVGGDVTSAKPLLANEGISSPGVKLHGAGFIVTPSEAKALGLGKREGLEKHIRPYLHGRDLLGRSRGVMVIDLFGLGEAEVRQRFPEVYEHLMRTVREDRAKQAAKSPTSDAKAYLQTFWVHGKPRPVLREALEGLPRYIATVETSKHRIFQFLDASILPDNMLVALASDDAFHLGVLLSRLHVEWALKAGGWLGFGNDSRYSKSKVFDPFPFPGATPEQRARIAELAEELDATRKAALEETPGLTMTEIYNLRSRIASGEAMDFAEQDRATRARAGIVNRLHEQIDEAVAAAYGWGDAWKAGDLAPSEIVARLVALNATRAAEEKAGTVRWLRPDYQEPRFGKDSKPRKKPAE